MELVENLQLPECLVIPIPYLLQEYPNKKIFELRDNHGWGFMHWAVAQCDQAKIAELKEFGFTLSLKSTENHLHEDFFNSFDNNISHLIKTNIPFTKGGFTPVHLSVYLHHQCEIYPQSNKGNFFFMNFKTKYQEFFNKLTLDDFALKDNSGLSVTDYCFLLENIEFIHTILKLDPELTTLNKVNLTTASQIIDFYQRHKAEKDSTLMKKLNHILININTKINFESLENKLNKKEDIPVKTNKI